jgi:ribosomal protein S18 acetylase RimI-like enzyme
MLLRPATAADRDFLLSVYASTRADELAQVPWDAGTRDAFVRQQYAAQETHYRAHYPQSLLQLIVDEQATPPRGIGRLWTDRRPDALHVLDISLLADARGYGVGTRCLLALREEAHVRDVPLSICVEIHNPARRLYERLGFKADGEPQGLYLRMVWPPVPALLSA